MLKLSIILISLLYGTQVLAHARLLAGGLIPPRNNNAGIKIGPCGGVPRTATPKVLQAGSTVTIQWEETINHPGRFEFYFSPAGDANFQLLKTVIDDQNNNLTPHQYTTSITLPNVTCTACTFQMIQVMTENPLNPSLYFSCADIQLTAAGVPPPPIVPPPVVPPIEPPPVVRPVTPPPTTPPTANPNDPAAPAHDCK
ncbi:MAG: SCE4755 family polysaccharide monooxygenase-like protein [Bdellovibrionota bacterium]